MRFGIREVDASPKAALLIESMRDIGYSLETAIADVIDNSITAGATSIQIHTSFGVPEVSIAIIDDGEGMTFDELVIAMRPGSRNPRSDRHSLDLGRFGLGLKTASFSQCRKLTVISKTQGQVSAATWDLDRVAETDEWRLQIPESDSLPYVDRLGECGTIVLWEQLDRVLEENETGVDIRQFVSRMADVAKHLELVFHRFLSGEVGTKKVRIQLNDEDLLPFDPFHSKHPATIVGPQEFINVGDDRVLVQTFTLPHHKKVPADVYERYASDEGYVKSQGFYVYRAKRLIISGTWFRLARQLELTKLARVRVDIPNGMDADWKIDVKKATATPPRQVRERLRRIIQTIGLNSKRVYSGAGSRLVSNDRLPVWNRVQNKNEISYEVNRNHPMVLNLSKKLPEYLSDDFRRVLDITAAGLPIDTLFADFGNDPNGVVGGQQSDDMLFHAVESILNHLKTGDYTTYEIQAIMQGAEPFRSSWEKTEKILERMGVIENDN